MEVILLWVFSASAELAHPGPLSKMQVLIFTNIYEV